MALQAVLTVITGTGRCGTRWLASVLRAAGLKVGHEDAFTPERVLPHHDVEVDVSWLALTHPNPFPTMIVGREPTGCIASLVDSLVFTEGDRYTKAMSRAIDLTGDAFTDACRWWCWANTRPADAYWRIDQPEELHAALAAVGLPTDDVDPYLPPDVHPLPGKRRFTEVAWDDLPPSVLEVAESWGWGC